MGEANAGKTRYEMTLDLQYGRIYNGLQARLFERIAAGIDIAELIAGTSVFAAFLADHASLGLWGAALFAVVPIANKIVDPRGKAMRAREQERAFVALLAEAAGLGDAALDRRIWQVRGVDFVEGLRNPAFNRTLEESGHAGPMRPISLWQSMLQVIA